MSRYIDADKLVAWCNKTFQAQSTVAGKAHVNALLTAVDSCSTADVVEVVRCKDCKYSSLEWIGGDLEGICKCGSAMINITSNSYCSYGERRENGT